MSYLSVCEGQPGLSFFLVRKHPSCKPKVLSGAPPPGQGSEPTSFPQGPESVVCAAHPSPSSGGSFVRKYLWGKSGFKIGPLLSLSVLHLLALKS